MTVISDTTPLHYLVLIGHAGILSVLFGKVVIPAAVASELQRPQTPEVVRAWMASPLPWLETRPAAVSQAGDLDHLGAG